MSPIKPEYSLKYEYDEMRERIEQMGWKSSRSNGDEIYPKLSAEFANDWNEKVKRITENQGAEGNNTIGGQYQRPDKTEEQMKMEKTLYHENSIYKILQQIKTSLPSDIDTNSKNIVVVADRYPREDIRGLSEEELIGEEDKRRKEGELTTAELRRWKRFSRREAVYSLTPENFDNLMRRFERGRQLQNANYEEIRSRRPQVEHRGNFQDDRSKPRRSPSVNTPSYISRDRSFQDRSEERKRPRISRSRSRSPTRSVETDRRYERISSSRSKSPRIVERRQERNPRSRSNSPRRVEVERRRERNPRSRSRSVEVVRRRERNPRSLSKSPRRAEVERSRERNPRPSSRSPRRSGGFDRMYNSRY